MKSENGETEKLQVVNGKIFQPLMAVESVFSNKELYFLQKQLFSIKMACLLNNRPYFDRKWTDFEYFWPLKIVKLILKIIFLIHQWTCIILYIKEFLIFVYFSNKLSSITIIRVQKIFLSFSYQRSMDNRRSPTVSSDRTMINGHLLIGLILF